MEVSVQPWSKTLRILNSLYCNMSLVRGDWLFAVIHNKNSQAQVQEAWGFSHKALEAHVPFSDSMAWEQWAPQALQSCCSTPATENLQQEGWTAKLLPFFRWKIIHCQQTPQKAKEGRSPAERCRVLEPPPTAGTASLWAPTREPEPSFVCFLLKRCVWTMKPSKNIEVGPAHPNCGDPAARPQVPAPAPRGNCQGCTTEKNK